MNSCSVMNFMFHLNLIYILYFEINFILNTYLQLIIILQIRPTFLTYVIPMYNLPSYLSKYQKIYMHLI
jgi:hypothetical protein